MMRRLPWVAARGRAHSSMNRSIADVVPQNKIRVKGAENVSVKLIRDFAHVIDHRTSGEGVDLGGMSGPGGDFGQGGVLA